MTIARIDASLVPRGAPGLRVVLDRDGLLREVSCVVEGTCLAILELEPGRSWGRYRGGIAGEEYEAGVIQPIGPFAGSDGSRPSHQSYEEWVRRQIAALVELGSGRSTHSRGE